MSTDKRDNVEDQPLLVIVFDRANGRYCVDSGKWVKLASVQRKRRPTLRQEIRRPAIKSAPKLVNAQAASQ